MTTPAYTAEQIAYHVDEARRMLHEPIKSFIALDESAERSVRIIEQQRAELEQLRAENARLGRENNALSWRIEDGLRATQSCFPEDLDAYGSAYEAFYEAQRMCRQALKKRTDTEEENDAQPN